MPPRDPHEPVRAATPLELLFDLVSVIAIAAAAAGLHHAISENHALDGIIRFGLAFFAIWWAWMNYTWFASAYDNNDAPFRLLTMVIMAGALAMAAGIGQFFKSLDLTLVVGGYVVMRLAMVALWLRTALMIPSGEQRPYDTLSELPPFRFIGLHSFCCNLNPSSFSMPFSFLVGCWSCSCRSLLKEQARRPGIAIT